MSIAILLDISCSAMQLTDAAGCQTVF
jgi:hypothetical protein